ncbi:WW domain-containing protein [Aphelenchoides besseyi]|nr:WW domain-containing protein [Aphelenchoides besseyi]
MRCSPTNSVDSVRLDREMLSKLERLAALRFKSVEEGVEPLYSIVEELIDCPLREDEPVVPDKQQASKPKPSSGRVKQVGQWSEQISSAGKRYYYNVVTEVSQWDKPAEWRAYEKKLSEQRNVRSSQPPAVTQSTPTTISKNGNATISTTAVMPTISSTSVTKNPLSSSNSQNVHVSSSAQAQPSTSHNVTSNSSSTKRESGRNGSTGRSSSNTPTNQHRSSSGVGNSSGHRDHAHVNGHSSSTRDHHSSESSSNRASTSSHHYQSSRDRHRSSDRNDREYSSKRSRSDRENQRSTPKYHSSNSNHGSREEKSRTSNSNAHPTVPTTSAPTTSTETSTHLTTDFVVSSASSIPQSSANFLQPPPPMPSVILDEPMEISLSLPTPTFTSFDETSYIRFYNPKMNFNRRFMANDATTNEVKRLSQKQWKQTKDLMEMDANIEAVRSLVLTAHNKRMLLDMKKDYLKNQAKNSTAASSSTTPLFPVSTATGTLSDSVNFSRPTSNSTPPIVNNSTDDFKSSAPKRARLEENGQTTGVTTTNNNLLTSSGFS